MVTRQEKLLVGEVVQVLTNLVGNDHLQLCAAIATTLVYATQKNAYAEISACMIARSWNVMS